MFGLAAPRTKTIQITLLAALWALPIFISIMVGYISSAIGEFVFSILSMVFLPLTLALLSKKVFTLLLMLDVFGAILMIGFNGFQVIDDSLSFLVIVGIIVPVSLLFYVLYPRFELAKANLIATGIVTCCFVGLILILVFSTVTAWFGAQYFSGMVPPVLISLGNLMLSMLPFKLPKSTDIGNLLAPQVPTINLAFKSPFALPLMLAMLVVTLGGFGVFTYAMVMIPYRALTTIEKRLNLKGLNR